MTTASAESFAEIRARSEAEWEAWQRPVRPRIEIALDTSAISAGAGAVGAAIAREASARNVAVDLGRTVGIGLQWLSPTVTISWPDGTRVVYGPVRPEHASMLLDEATGRVGAAASITIGTLAGSRPGVPRVFDHPFFANEVERRLLA